MDRYRYCVIPSGGNKNQCELVLDGGFKVPIVAVLMPPISMLLVTRLGFFLETANLKRLDYDVESERQKQVEEFYKTTILTKHMTFDPDLDEPQIEHLLQTAEAIRKDYPDEDWLHLTALIHDLGKVLLLPKFGELPQWAVVGDTHPLGCAFDESIVHHKYFNENPDSNNPAYQTKNGIYPEGCGLDNVMISWGHDDYMYLVAKENGTTLPQAGLFIIRYHSFYPLHRAGAYKHLMNEEDVENLKWLQIFNKYDLYSKSKVHVDIEKVKPYYLSLIEKT
ncbi:hypothetical protein OSB04_020441 [Centaurea solstitialis]|uniref:Inositol oxygenase n=1 Tax=Centaurea solstitialis TaxID=347529 RepID=A0AA38TBT7_9ASTR|nr:hypothetical protein OSB04_020441 [Centaurea solstitialis]